MTPDYSSRWSDEESEQMRVGRKAYYWAAQSWADQNLAQGTALMWAMAMARE